MSRVAHVEPARGGGSLMVAWRLEGRRVLVVGGGKVAAGRVLLALQADAEVTVVAPSLTAELRHRWSRGELTWRPDVFHDDDLDGTDLVLACLDDADASSMIAASCRSRRIPVNCADHTALCDFWFASTHRDGPLQVALSTNGSGPALGSRLVQELTDALPAGVGAALEAFGVLRQQIRLADPHPASSRRRMGWLAQLARTWDWTELAALDEAAIDQLVARYLADGDPPRPPRERPSRPRSRGRVTLVGAGPGDPALLTQAARTALAQADLVLADRIVSPEILDLVQGELRIARKLPGRAQDAQDELDQWTLDAVAQGRHVVRLKCGDPFVFGRGGEELALLARHGIEAEVVPGVTSAFAAPLAAGIPTTMRGYADRVLVLTATGRHESRPTAPAFDDHTTYVYLMGVARLDRLVDELRAAGFPEHWPAAVVERATQPGQRTVRGTLASLPALVAQAGLAAPATLVIGRVVDALAEAALQPVEAVSA